MFHWQLEIGQISCPPIFVENRKSYLKILSRLGHSHHRKKIEIPQVVNYVKMSTYHCTSTSGGKTVEGMTPPKKRCKSCFTLILKKK